MTQEQMASLSQFVMLLLQVVITAAIPFVLNIVLKWVNVRLAMIKTQVGGDQISLFREAVSVVVAAAEQSGVAGIIENEGKAKKQWAIDTLQKIVTAHGWSISVAQIEAEIEHGVAMGWANAGETGKLQDVFGLPHPDAPVEEEPEPEKPAEPPVSPTQTPSVAPAAPVSEWYAPNLIKKRSIGLL